MIKQLSKVGNSHALLLDKPLLELLGLEEDGQVQLVIEGGRLIVTPTHPTLVDPDVFEDKLDYVINKRQELLKKLAE